MSFPKNLRTLSKWAVAGKSNLQNTTSSLKRFNRDTSYDILNDAALVDNNGLNNYQEGSRRYTSGWRFGAINCATAVAVVFLINLTVTIWGSVHGNFKNSVLFDGNCERARQINTVLHLIINLLSTILLSCSNYTMQILSAPTRKEVDKAHEKGQWLDIGVPSIHNLRRISRHRVVLWALLGISSLPLHLFYNSAVFLSISVNDYYVIHVRESFISSPDCGDCCRNNNSCLLDYDMPAQLSMLHAKALNNELDRLNNTECIRQYAQMFQSTRRNLFLVTADDKVPKQNDTIYGGPFILSDHSYATYLADHPSHTGSMYDWICAVHDPKFDDRILDMPCDVEKVDWRVGGGSSQLLPIDYCLSEKANQHCKIQFTLFISILVTFLNLFKALLIFFTAFGVEEDPLLTMGDAVVSFLMKRDETTRGMCLLSINDIKKHRGYFPVVPKEWKVQTHRWKDAASRIRRLVTFVVFTTMLAILTALLIWGIHQLPHDVPRSIPGIQGLGFGAIDGRTIISFGFNYTMPLIGLLVITNVAQLILSFLYFSYNGLFTSMLMGYEWSSYTTSRKGLRVSRAPQGLQRSTYFLQLPYRFALPLMVLSGMLHWLISQSIFLVAIDAYDSQGNHTPEFDLKSCGYSPIAMFTTLMLGIAMNLVAFGVGWIPHKKSFVLVGTCSAAISAACHSVDESEADGYEAAISKLQWGAIGRNADGMGHCGFSKEQVGTPKVGQMYAG